MLNTYFGNCPKNVAKDAKYTVRAGNDEPVIALTYNTGDGERWFMTIEDHSELARMVNNVKVRVSGKPNGSFYINEYNQVIVPAVNSPEYYLAGIYSERLHFQFEGKTISGAPVDLGGRPLAPGSEWFGPHAGIPYTLTAGGDDVYYQFSPRPDVTRKVRLSKQIGTRDAAAVADQIRSVKGFHGGRFYVNEFHAIFTPLNDGVDLKYIYVGQLDIKKWFARPDGDF
jgi:hypothetical protein